jgi:hypothetical protein
MSTVRFKSFFLFRTCMNALTEPPSYPFPSRQRAVLLHVKHPVFWHPDLPVIAFTRPLRRALPCLAF